MIQSIPSKCLILITLGIITFWGYASHAQTDESKVKAMWVHTLMSYIKWDRKNNSDKIICTRGLDRTYNFLKEVQNEQKTSYEFIETGSNSNLEKCNLLYIATSETNNVTSILSSVESKNIVTVSDIKGFAEDGGIIELSPSAGKVTLKINVKSAKKANIIINSDLLAVSTIINN